MNNFRHINTTRADGVHISFLKKELPDCFTTPDDCDCYTDEDKAAYNRGDWCFLGVRAVACIMVMRNGVGTMYELESAGIFGIMSTDGDGIDDAYDTQKAELLEDIKYFRQTLSVAVE
jgi:hypothetical protein